jgi:hypothetical protein
MCESKDVLSVALVKQIGYQIEPNIEAMSERQTKQFAEILADLSSKQILLNTSNSKTDTLETLKCCYEVAVKNDRDTEARYFFEQIKNIVEK